MAVSTPPPPPSDPPLTTTTTTTATATAARPRFPINPRPPHLPHQPPPSLYSTTPTTRPSPHTLVYRHPSCIPNPNYPRVIPSSHPSHDSTATSSTTTAPIATATSILYPVASSGRGFIRQTQSVSSVANCNSIVTSNLYSGLPVGVPSSYAIPPYGYSHPAPALGQGTVYVSSVGNSTHLQQAGVVGNSAVKGAVVSAPFSQSQHKVTLSSTPVSNFNGHKDIRERSKDDVFVTVNDRKVRASDNASLYALCRSWLKNGFSEESQLQNLDAVRSLPRPSPLSAQDDASPTSMAEPEEVEEEEESVENLTQKELLQQHVKRAKRVRSRIREQRLRRIAPYKTRLALLLRPMVDSNLKNDSVTGETK